MRPVRLGKTAGAHIGVPERLELFEAVALADLLEGREELVEQVDQAPRLQALGEPRESLEIGEHDGRRLVEARRDPIVLLQLFRDLLWKDIEQQPLGFLALGFDLLARALEVLRSPLELQQAAPELELAYRLVREAADGLGLLEAQLARLEIDHAQRAEGIALRIDQGHPAVEPQVRLSRHQRILRKPLVLREIGNEKQ